MIDIFFLNNMYWQTCQQIISFFYHIYYNLVGEFCDCFNQFQILENTLYLTALTKKIHVLPYHKTKTYYMYIGNYETTTNQQDTIPF